MRKAAEGYGDCLVVFPRGKTDGYFEVAEKHEDGSVTFWPRNMGERGTLRADVETKPVTTKKERECVDHKRRMIQRGIEVTDALYQSMKARESIIEVEDNEKGVRDVTYY